MSQKTVFICDHCGTEFGEKRHLTFTFSKNNNNRSFENTGVAVPPSQMNPHWGVHNKLNGKTLQFCNGECVGAYFAGYMAATEEAEASLAVRADDEPIAEGTALMSIPGNPRGNMFYTARPTRPNLIVDEDDE